MAHMKYGCLHPNPKTTEYPVAAGVYFRHDQPNMVYVDASGNLALVVTATATVKGVAIVPKGRGAGTSDDYYLSNATAAVDRFPVIDVDEGYNFIWLADDTPTASQAGDACDLLGDDDGTVFYVDIGTSSTDVCIIQGRGVDYKADAAANDVVVKMNPAKRQTDT